MSRHHHLLVPAALLAVSCSPATDFGSLTQAVEGNQGPISVQILGINDFHGNLEPPQGSNANVTTGFDALNKPITTVAGGATYLATHIRNLRAANSNTLFVSAGDLIGASPLVSALFHDEPTVEAFNAMGLNYNATGNHEFDEGPAELKRMQEGGCHPVDGCQDGDGFAGASFTFLDANVFKNDDDKEKEEEKEKEKEKEKNEHTLFPPYKVRSFGGAKVAIIGLVLKETPSIVSPQGVAGLTFTDEADAANALVRYLKGKGVQAFVVAIHQGGAQSGVASGQYNDCKGLGGPILDIVNRLDPAVQAVLSAHTHNAYNCNINGRIVASAASFGRLITKVDLTLDKKSGAVLSAAAQNMIVSRDVVEDPAVKTIVDKYKALVAPFANKVVGSITADIRRVYKLDGVTRDDGKESALGDVIADAQLASTVDPGRGGAVVAFMNPGGVRADLVFASSPVGEGDGNVTYSEAFTVQPFFNVLATVTLTGQQIKDVLEQQFAANQPTGGRLLQVSSGFTYAYSAIAPIGSKVDVASIKINGVAIDLAASYRVTINSFLADGGDNFTVFKSGTSRLGGDVDIDALVKYFGAASPIAPGPRNRITVNP